MSVDHAHPFGYKTPCLRKRSSCARAFHGSGALAVACHAPTAHGTTTSTTSPRALGATTTSQVGRSKNSKWAGIWLVELIILAGLAGGAGATAIQEVNYYQPNRLVAKTGKVKHRHFHTLCTECEDHLARIRWVKGEKATRASVILQKRVGGKVSADLNEILVVVPSKWRFISKVETLRDETPPEKICELGSKLALLGELGL